MIDDWAEFPFTEAVQVNPRVRLQRGEPYPFVDMGDVSQRSHLACSTGERDFTGGGSKFQDGDTLMARITPCLENGKIARFRAPHRLGMGHGSTEFIVIRGRPGVTDTAFAYYLTQWEEVRSFAISQMTGTSGRQRVPTDSLEHLTIAVPDISEQLRIARLLGALDDRIELSGRISEGLIAVARALFQAWFVFYGANIDVLSLPSRFRKHFPRGSRASPSGAPPEGWRVEEMGLHVEVERGVSYDGDAISGTGVPFHNLNSIYEGGGYKYEGIKTFSGEFDDRRAVVPGDVIVANTEQGHDRLLLASAALVPACFGIRTPFSHHLYRVRPKPCSPLRPTYIAYLLNSLRFHDLVSRYGNGTTVNMLPTDALSLPEIVVPPEELVVEFDRLVRALHLRMECAVLESQTLRSIRDALLPKLISGEVRVKASLRETMDAAS